MIRFQKLHLHTFIIIFFRKPVTFWITNPLTKMKNNVAAAGGEVSGFVFDLSDI